ncbi:MAG: hypothetical protein LBC92_02920 [Rickettsiales bacterium]|jgi:hypothetical protein|nr:hypothetical protein [Rickettsiales bacterium]
MLLILPQTTCREQRVDDDPRFTEVVKKEEFKSRNFLVGDNVYATDQNKFMNFIHNNKDNDTLIMIIGTNNIEPLKRIVDTNFPNCKLHNICLRLRGKNKEQEKVILEKNLQNFFKPNEQDRVKKNTTSTNR